MSASRARRTVLIADPDAGVRRQLVRSLSAQLAEAPVEVQTCESVDSALSLLGNGRVDVAFFDQTLLRNGGPRLSAALTDVEVVVGTRPGELPAVADAPPFVRSFVERPASSAEASGYAIARALDVVRLRELARKADVLAAMGDDGVEIVAASKSTRALVARARRVAPTASPILVMGEPGTGKELLARLVYRVSQRGVLVSVDASELSREDVERELGARPLDDGSPVSAWERAEGATLLLLHVEQLSPSAQAAVLARLAAPSRSVRVIATADNGLLEKVQADAFDRDLYLALGRPLLELASLRQRSEEIPVLANHFLLQFLRTHPATSRELRIGVEAMRALRRNPWPRNVTELESAIMHAALVARTSTIVPGDLPDQEGAPRTLRTSLGEESYARARARVIAEFEREYVEEVLARTDRNIAQAAREAGMDRANFRRLWKRARGKKTKAAPVVGKKPPVRRPKAAPKTGARRGAEIRPDEPDRGES